MAAPDDFDAWFRLLATPGLGRATARRLLAACGSPEGVLRAPRATLQALAPAEVVRALGTADATTDERLALTRRWLNDGPARSVITLGDAAYPTRLLQTADPPLLLYVEGDAARLGAASLSIVGSRSATAQGLDNARAFAAALGREGLVVVSGLAVGIDAAAHEGALEAPAGTIAVLGTGLDPVYPPRHAGLARRVAAHGAVVSEHAPGTPPLRENFPQRNRIIAGLSLGTLVVEAAVASGSLITARQAAEAGREVFAIPGSIHSPQARGCHALIKQGAKLVESADDILDELRGASGLPGLVPRAMATRSTTSRDAVAAATAGASARDPGDPLLEALGHDPVTLDALLARTGYATGELNARLLELELAGRVARLPGGLFQRRADA